MHGENDTFMHIHAVQARLAGRKGKKTESTMDKPTRIRRVTINTERTFTFTSRSGVGAAWCAECGAEVRMVSVDRAAREAGVSEFAIYKLVDARAIHSREDGEGRVLVCLNSLQ